MKVLCFLFLLLLYITKFICSHQLNVGTVLFTKSHLCKRCWTESDMKLLSARRAMQGVLPDPDHLDISKSGTITVLLEYFQSCFEAICQSSRKSPQIMFLALADALGGYLRSYILPLTRQAFYAGHIKYIEAKKAYQFYEEIKEFLKTNGAGWAKPHICILQRKIQPLRIATKSCQNACSQLYLLGETPMDACRNLQSLRECDRKGMSTCPSVEQELKEIRRIIDEIGCMTNKNECTPPPTPCVQCTQPPPCYQCNQLPQVAEYTQQPQCTPTTECTTPSMCVNGIKIDEQQLESSDMMEESVQSVNCNCNNPTESPCPKSILLPKKHCCPKKRPPPPKCTKHLIVPLPILDDPVAPNAIGLPFRTRPLRSLSSPQAVSVLVRYYVLVTRCLGSKVNKTCNIQNFNAQFQAWLTCNVFPHLSDEKWYPAFGSVLRIQETINQAYGGNCMPKCECPTNSDIGFMFPTGYGFDAEADGCEETEPVNPPHRAVDDRVYYTTGIITIVFLWIVTMCYCISCHCTGKRGGEEIINITSPDPSGTGTVKERESSESNNSFLVRCLIKFFKRKGEEERKSLVTSKETVNYNVYYDQPPLPRDVGFQDELPTVFGKSKTDESVSMKSCSVESKRRPKTQRDMIVLPAQINPISPEAGQDHAACWPFTVCPDNSDVERPHTEERSPLEERPKIPTGRRDREPISKPHGGKEQFRTLWKRHQVAARTSESGEGLCIRNTREIVQHVRQKRKADVLSRSSYSGSEGSPRRLIIVKKSRSGFDCQNSYSYSYDSSLASYSPSQGKEEIPAEFLGHVKICHNYYTKKSRIDSQSSNSESESERCMTSTNTSEQSFSSRKRKT